MNIHEYQAKKLLRSYNLPVPEGIDFKQTKDIASSIQNLKGPPWVIKSQIHAGGRGAGYFLGYSQDSGGVRLVNSLEEIKKEAAFMLGNKLITKQTGLKGKQVNTVYIETKCLIKKEFYLSILVDRQSSKVILITSASGGIDIEEIALKEPDKILTYYFEELNKVNTNDLLYLANKLSLNSTQGNEFCLIVKKLLKIFKELDASTIEINPLVINNENSLLLLDAKITFDDNALFRHPEILQLRDESEEDPLELEATKNHMNYVRLEGSIGCMVNGAGLAMATMDIIKHFGSEPANFLDLGGTATKNRTINGFRIIQSDTRVKAILINIFGGIIRCDMIAESIIYAAKELNVKLPVIVRFQGTNADRGREVINNSKLNIITANTLSEAAKKAVEASRY